MEHEYYMKKVFELANRGLGRTNPNPLVGAIIVKDGNIVAEGFHEQLGSIHAEVAALKNAVSDVTGGVLYVNLEPCSHYGRTPPCTKAIIDAKIKKVVIAMIDPNPKVCGKGVQILREAGIEVECGILEDDAKKLNEIFIKYITKKTPFVIMKTAMTLDGKIASITGDSKWITNEKSRRYVHTIRNRVAAIMVGIGTVLKDNPALTTRLEDGKIGIDAIRVIVDSKGVIPLNSKVINQKSNANVILATTPAIDYDKEAMLIERGVKIIKVGTDDERVNLVSLMDELYKMEIDSILLEGGGELNASALKVGIVDKAMFFISPKIIGGRHAITPVEGCGFEFIKDAVILKNMCVSQFDEDILIEGYFNN